MKRILPLLLILTAFAACTETVHHAKALEEAEALLGSRPEEALRMLDSIGRQDGSMGKKERMRWQLLRLTAQNKCYVPFKSDSAALEVAGYYDRHGTPNERMAAHYLLGCAYRDMGEAPMALQCFQEAVECADTTAADCDKRQLTIILIQTGYLYYTQYMPSLALEQFGKASAAAWGAGDTLLHLNAEEYKMLAYYELSDYTKVDSITDNLHTNYLALGDTVKAKRCVSTSLLLAAKNGNLDRMKKLFAQKYGNAAQNPTLDDAIDTEEKSLLAYYLLRTGQERRAEALFRQAKEKSSNIHTQIRCLKGLFELYSTHGPTDSLSKYARAYCALNDSSNIFKHNETLSRMQALYRYNRVAAEAEHKTREVQERYVTTLLVALLAIVATLYFILLYKRKGEQLSHKIEMQDALYERLNERYRMVSDDMEKLVCDNQQKNSLLKEKEHLLELLRQKISDYEQQNYTGMKKNRQTLESIAAKLHDMAEKGTAASSKLLYELKMQMETCDGQFIEKIRHQDYHLDLREEYICILVQKKFTSSEIAILMGMSPQALSNKKKRIATKLSGREANAADLATYLTDI